MKKILLVLLIAVIVLSATSCNRDIAEPGNSQEPSPTNSQNGNNKSDILDKSCQEIIEYVYANMDETILSEKMKDSLMYYEVNEENAEYYIGKKNLPYESALASEGEIQPSTYSFCIVKLKDGQDYETVKTTIADNVDPQKWVCMGAETVYVERIDNVICIIMGNKETASALKECFLSLAE